jgi:hypothetical protein
VLSSHLHSSIATGSHCAGECGKFYRTVLCRTGCIIQAISFDPKFHSYKIKVWTSCISNNCDLWGKSNSWTLPKSYCLVAFHGRDKIPKKNQLKRRKDWLCSWFQRFQSRVAQLHLFGPVARQNIMTESVWWSKTVHLLVTRMQEKGQSGGTRVPIAPSRAYLQWPHFLPVGPTFCIAHKP